MRRGPGERLAAWLYTGPLGHFWSTAADLGVYLLGSAARKLLSRAGAEPDRTAGPRAAA